MRTGLPARLFACEVDGVRCLGTSAAQAAAVGARLAAVRGVPVKFGAEELSEAECDDCGEMRTPSELSIWVGDLEAHVENHLSCRAHLCPECGLSMCTKHDPREWSDEGTSDEERGGAA